MDEQAVKQAVLKFTGALRNAGIHTVSLSYSGSGDEGQTEDPQLGGAIGNPIPAEDVHAEIDLADFGDLLEHFVPEGYANNDGGGGQSPSM